jgi:ABC-type nitrate/sulfonate/bicarbonate transport system ATPase subunit
MPPGSLSGGSDGTRSVPALTHDLDEALYLSGRIVLMDGRPGPALKAAILDCLHALHAV